jgi:hypothetical protein
MVWIGDLDHDGMKTFILSSEVPMMETIFNCLFENLMSRKQLGCIKTDRQNLQPVCCRCQGSYLYRKMVRIGKSIEW